MNELEQKIYNVLLKYTLEENNALLNLGKGIFDIPELALAYFIGKNLFAELFINNGYKWQKEISISDSSITDLVFNSHNNSIAIEFKMDDTWHAYKKDIKKLDNIRKTNISKYFISLKKLLDDSQAQSFKSKLESEFSDTSLLLDYKIFDTIISSNSRYGKCLLTFWKVR